MAKKVKMIKTQAPNEIPNGSIGQAEDSIGTAGLHYAIFERGDKIYQAYVYSDEVKILGT